MYQDGSVCVISYPEQIPKSFPKAEPYLAHCYHHQSLAQGLARVSDRQVLLKVLLKVLLEGDPGTDPEQSVKYGEGSQNHVMSRKTERPDCTCLV